MNTLQQDLDGEDLAVPVQLHIINEVGFEHGQEDMATLVDLPLLQDTRDENAWNDWNVTYRDIIVLDEKGRFVGTHNVSANDLTNPASLETLENLLMSAMD